MSYLILRGGEVISGLEDLCSYIKEHFTDNITLVEVGVYTGESTMIFRKCLPNARLICIDPWQSGYDPTDAASNSDMNQVEAIFDQRRWLLGNITKVKGTSEDFKINQKIDIVYIDGNHSYEGVKKDILYWKDKVQLAIAGHDYGSTLHPGVKQAVDESFTIDKTFVDQSWIKIKEQK